MVVFTVPRHVAGEGQNPAAYLPVNRVSCELEALPKRGEIAAASLDGFNCSTRKRVPVIPACSQEQAGQLQSRKSSFPTPNMCF